jgi:hypothetical protein
MKVLRGVVLLGIAAAVAAGTASAGGDAGPPLYPSLVNVQLVRAQKLLDNAAEYQDEGDSAKAVAMLTATRSHLRKAWLAAKYIIDTAPPPVAGDSSLKTKKPTAVKRSRVRARASGAPVAGASPYADQYATALAVLDLDHQVAVTAMGMLDTAAEPLLTAVSTTLFASLTARDDAIAYIHSVDKPIANTSTVRGAPVVAGWAGTMSGVGPIVDDELTQVDGIRATVKLSTGRKRIIDAVELQDVRTGRNIAKYWPPVVGG